MVQKRFPWWLSGKEATCQCIFDPWVWKIPWRRQWQPTLVFLSGKSLGQRNLAGYSPWGLKRVRHNLVTKITNNMIIVVQLPSHTPQSFTIAQSLLKFISIELVMLPNHLIPCCPILHLPSVFPSMKVFSSELVLHIRWPKNWSFSFSKQHSI